MAQWQVQVFIAAVGPYPPRWLVDSSNIFPFTLKKYLKIKAYASFIVSDTRLLFISPENDQQICIQAAKLSNSITLRKFG